MQIALYGILLAAGALVLQWLDYQRWARSYAGETYAVLIALFFLVIGVAVGFKVFGARRGGTFNGNPQAREALGLSERELEVLQKLAEGISNKEIAAQLHLSPNTVKTHLARVFEKLGAKRRTDALNRARELGILP